MMDRIKSYRQITCVGKVWQFMKKMDLNYHVGFSTSDDIAHVEINIFCGANVKF